MVPYAPLWLQCSLTSSSSSYFQFSWRAVLLQLKITWQSFSQLNDHHQVYHMSVQTVVHAQLQRQHARASLGRCFSEVEVIANMKPSHLTLLQGRPYPSDRFLVSSLYFSSSIEWRLVNHLQVNTSLQIKPSLSRL